MKNPIFLKKHPIFQLLLTSSGNLACSPKNVVLVDADLSVRLAIQKNSVFLKKNVQTLMLRG